MKIENLPAIAAIVCFAVAVLSAVGTFNTNTIAWLAGGLLALAVAIVAPWIP